MLIEHAPTQREIAASADEQNLLMPSGSESAVSKFIENRALAQYWRARGAI
jgi:hypothetical protein